MASSSSSSSSDPPFFANNITAESHYRAARDAISSTFDKFIEQHEVGGWGPTHDGKSKNDTVENDTTGSKMDKENSAVNSTSMQRQEEETDVDPELVKQFFGEAKSSLLHNFDRIVKPIPDDEYSDYVDQYHFVLDNKRPLEEEMEEENDNDRNTTEHDDDDDEEEEPEIDEEELIDASAWGDARELRSRVRAKAARVQQLRERVLNATTNRVMKMCLQPHAGDVKPEIIMGEAESTSEIKATTKKVDESLKTLSSLLDDPKWKQFPERIQSLQDTIEVMQKDSAPNRLLSQTELAITGGRRNIAVASKSNVVDGICQDATAEGEDGEVDQYKDPMEDILAKKVLLMQVQDTGRNNDDDLFGLESHQGGEKDVGDDMHIDTEDKENSTSQPMDAIDRLALFGHMFS